MVLLLQRRLIFNSFLVDTFVTASSCGGGHLSFSIASKSTGPWFNEHSYYMYNTLQSFKQILGGFFPFNFMQSERTIGLASMLNFWSLSYNNFAKYTPYHHSCQVFLKIIDIGDQNKRGLQTPATDIRWWQYFIWPFGPDSQRKIQVKPLSMWKYTAMSTSKNIKINR